jgi:hypothetical protein
MFMTGSGTIDAEQAFARAARASRRAAFVGALRRDRAAQRRLPVYREPRRPRGGGGRAVMELPLDAISGTLEPSRAAQFDCCFRPVAASARHRWQRIWLAEQRGAVLPPISVVPVGDSFAVRDGHHRVSVARARGAVAIDASIDAV